MIIKHSSLFMMLALLAFFSYGEEVDKPVDNPDLAQPVQIADDESIDEKAWGIRHGCIDIKRIDSINYFSPRTAKVTLRGNKTVLMIFKNSCRGLRNHAAVIESRTGTLCEKFDSIGVYQRGTVCLIESIEPFVDLDDGEDSEEDSNKDNGKDD